MHKCISKLPALNSCTVFKVQTPAFNFLLSFSYKNKTSEVSCSSFTAHCKSAVLFTIPLKGTFDTYLCPVFSLTKRILEVSIEFQSGSLCYL